MLCAARREEDIAEGLRRHDTRHTTGSRFLRVTGNLKATQKLLGHARIETTTRYAHVLIDDIRSGLEAMERAYKTPVTGKRQRATLRT